MVLLPKLRIAGLILLAVSPAMAAAGAPRTGTGTDVAFDPKAAIARSQAAIGRPLGDYAFLDTRRRPVRLADFRGKPLVVNLVFTACTDSCPIVVQTLSRAVEIAQEAVGEDAFAVVTIGFDARDDTPERMRAFARSQGIDLPNWTFLSGDTETVDRLVDNLGLIYFPSPRGFDHLAQTSVIDREGRVYRQVYGAQFDPPALVEPLVELAFGRRAEAGLLTNIVNGVRLFCTYYDPKSQRYRFDYAIFIGFAVGAASLIGVGTILVRAWLRDRAGGRAA